MIFGERIRFRAIERADLPVFVTWLNDPEVRAGISAYLPLSLVREESWFENMLKKPVEEHPFAIEAKREGDWFLIGTISLFEFSWRTRKAEIGIMIGEKTYWNQGYGTEAMLLMLQHGFETLNLHRIYLKVYSTNPRAIRAYEKVGFVHEGRLREAHYADGVYADDLVMSMLRPEWEEKVKPSKSRSVHERG